MMNILLVAATSLEIEPLKKHFDLTSNEFNFQTNKGNCKILVTGVGMVATAMALGMELQNDYDLVVNLGIAGSFNHRNSIGDVVVVSEDQIFEAGAEDGDKFLSPEAMELCFEYCFINESTTPFQELNKLPKQKSITVNKVHGNKVSIEKIRHTMNVDLETMEGAAFMYACNKYKVPHIQVRGISNYVEVRNKNNWDIKGAISAVNSIIIKCLE